MLHAYVYSKKYSHTKHKGSKSLSAKLSWICACFLGYIDALREMPHLQVGWLADSTNRRNLLFWVVVMGEAPCLATYWVRAWCVRAAFVGVRAVCVRVCNWGGGGMCI